MIKEAIIKVVEGKDLNVAEMEESFSEIMSGQAQPSQIAAFVTALRLKGETVDEITAAAKVMRKFATSINVYGVADREDINIEEEIILDTCGTGGTGVNTFNISTTVAFVVAGCGVKVAKHGNRSASSECGSADALEKLGINLHLPPEEVEECIKKIGIGFMFAPLFHSAMRYAAPVRKEIGIRTIFNILGPLANPAHTNCQLLGVYKRELTPIMAEVLANLGVKRAFVVYGFDTLDEISITGPTQISELKDKKVRTYKIRPEMFGFKRARLEDIKGGNSQDNAQIILSVLGGKKGACRDVVLLNSAYALVAADKARDVRGAIGLAQESIDSGKAMEKLNLLKGQTQSIITSAQGLSPILSKIIQAKRKSIAEAKERVSLNEISKMVSERKNHIRDFKHAISQTHNVNIIAEIKQASPAKGVIRRDFDPAKIAEAYQINGACAISVLTEERYFLGSIDHIKMVKDACSLPVLRKDFILEDYQVYESILFGADALLLIADILSKEEVKRLYSLANSLGMSVLCETHTEEGLEKILASKAEIIGINNRNLHTFKLNIDTTQNLIGLIPKGKIIVSESGIRSYTDVLFLKSLGVNAVLIGEVLMETDDISTKLREFIGR